MLHTLNLHSDMYQLFLNKTEGGTGLQHSTLFFHAKLLCKMISSFYKYFVLRFLRSLRPQNQTPSFPGLHIHNRQGFYCGLDTGQTGPVDTPTLSPGQPALNESTQTGNLRAGWFPGRVPALPLYSDSTRGCHTRAPSSLGQSQGAYTGC